MFYVVGCDFYGVLSGFDHDGLNFGDDPLIFPNEESASLMVKCLDAIYDGDYSFYCQEYYFN